MLKTELSAVLEDACKANGVYEVTKILRDIASATSQEYKAIGNDGAIVHSDAHILQVAVMNMALSHPLRMGDLQSKG